MIEHTTFSLPNGLRFIHHQDPQSAMVAMDVLYNVGARDEDPSMTGLAHLFEHLMFGGSANIPDFDRQLELAGGWSNAWTSNDFTNFYSLLPAGNAETAFWLESDRMLSLAFSRRALDTQRRVVIEEFKQTCLNQPYGDMPHHLRALLYRVHPYRWPTIGLTPEHIKRVRLDDIKSFFYSHYAPDNAVVAVAGNITLDRTREFAERWFAEIPSRDIKPRVLPVEPPIEAPRTVEVKGRVPVPAITIAYPMGPRGGEHYEAADILTDILASGRSSRIQTDLLRQYPVFTEADASIIGSEDPGALTIACRLRSDSRRTINQAISILNDKIGKLITEGVTEHELTRAVNIFESRTRYAHTSVIQKAQSLASALLCGYDINSILPRYRSLTVSDINDAISAIIRPQASATLTYRPT